MGWTKKQFVLALVMVITGSINTLSAKWADKIKSKNSFGDVVEFSHPFFQADTMFIGEMLCLATFYANLALRRRRNLHTTELALDTATTSEFPKWIFWAPAVCDMTATSLMFVGLIFTYASSFQMLRGAVIVFTGLMSVAFLNRRLRYYQWMGIGFVILGLVLVGLSDFLNSSDNSQQDINGIITGDLLIVMAQIVTALQMVLEEKFIMKYNVPPLQVVGYEGIFGFLTLSVLLIPMYYIPGGMFSSNERGVLEDTPDAFVQIKNNPLLILAILLNITSIAFFNFAGVSVTKELSATTRMVLDSVRTLVIWLFSIAVQWQAFQYLQPIGFLILVIGMMLYNDVLIMPFLRRLVNITDRVPEGAPILSGTVEPNQDVTGKREIDPF
ncbi:solute carrier family 35 member F6-like [Macrobrachium nipponense]|uniref:solute carrier family 35 member F6-like n=1 Tax=Macrobrachium nipponense TaxID=159736 RepID=UPI0030C84B2D